MPAIPRPDIAFALAITIFSISVSFAKVAKETEEDAGIIALNFANVNTT
jgi:hypothetical protein